MLSLAFVDAFDPLQRKPITSGSSMAGRLDEHPEAGGVDTMHPGGGS
jgi:hypothetical protein